MTTIIETKRLRFRRLPYDWVSGYKIYLTYGKEDESFLGYLRNPILSSPEECIEENVKVYNGRILMPKGACRDNTYYPKILLNNQILSESDYSYSLSLNQIELSAHINVSNDDVLDLIYYKDLIVYEHQVEHLHHIEPIIYRVEPVYRDGRTVKM